VKGWSPKSITGRCAPNFTRLLYQISEGCVPTCGTAGFRSGRCSGPAIEHRPGSLHRCPFRATTNDCGATVSARTSIFLGGIDVELAEREVLEIDGFPHRLTRTNRRTEPRVVIRGGRLPGSPNTCAWYFVARCSTMLRLEIRVPPPRIAIRCAAVAGI